MYKHTNTHKRKTNLDAQIKLDKTRACRHTHRYTQIQGTTNRTQIKYQNQTNENLHGHLQLCIQLHVRKRSKNSQARIQNEHTHKNMHGRIVKRSRKNTLTKNIHKSNKNQVTKQAIKNSHAHLHISSETHAQEYSRNMHARTHACIGVGTHENKQ